MKLIESQAELLQQPEGLEGVYKQIELAGRTAYHSLDKITLDSAKDFVDRMIKSKHGAALEHGTVYLHFFWPGAVCQVCNQTMPHKLLDKYCISSYSKVNYHGNDVYVTTNMRVLQENNWLDDLQYLCPPSEFHEKRYTIRFTCSRAIAQELTRHRVFSFLMESQRYINYSKERHGGEVTYIIPSWCNFEPTQIEEYEQGNLKHTKVGEYALLSGLLKAEDCYMTMLSDDCTPQQARDVLPNATKTELIMTGFASDWRFFFDLRYYGETGKPHPDMELLASKARNEFIKAGLWDDIMKYPSKFN